MSKFLVGWAEESIVPGKPVNIVGQFYERISDKVETEITVTALAIESGDQKMIAVSCDLTGISAELIRIAREKYVQLGGEVAPEKIFIGCIHNHTAMGYGTGKSPTKDILNEFLPDGKKYTSIEAKRDDVFEGEEALLFLADKIANAAKKAWDARKEAKYANAFGRAVVGHCRRVVYDDGSAKMWGDSNHANFNEVEGGSDSGIELIYFFDRDKKLTGIMANIACPAQVLEHHYFISADYWGYVKQNLREKYGKDIFLIPFIGAAGDQCPRDMVRWVDPEQPVKDPHITRENTVLRKADPSMFDIKGCKLIAKRVTNEIIDVFEALEDEEIKSEPIFKHKALTFDLPLRKATIAEYEHAVREIEYYVNKNRDKDVFNFKDNAAMYVYAGTILRYRKQQESEIYPIETHIIRLGDIAIATNPFELFLDYGNRMKARSKAQQTFIFQLTGGIGGYLPTEKAEKGSHYSAYITSGNVGHEGGDLLVRRTVKEINELFE